MSKVYLLLLVPLFLLTQAVFADDETIVVIYNGCDQITIETDGRIIVEIMGDSFIVQSRFVIYWDAYQVYPGETIQFSITVDEDDMRFYDMERTCGSPSPTITPSPNQTTPTPNPDPYPDPYPLEPMAVRVSDLSRKPTNLGIGVAGLSFLLLGIVTLFIWRKSND